MKCSGKFYGMQVSMTQLSDHFWKLIFTKVTNNTSFESLQRCGISSNLLRCRFIKVRLYSKNLMLKEGLTGVIAFTANAKIFGILRLQ